MGFTKDLALGTLCLLALAWSGFVGWDIHKEVRARQLQKPDGYPQYSDLLLGLGMFVGMLLAQLLFRPLFAVVARAMIVKKPRWSYAVYGAKVTQCCDSVFKCSYYAAMTVWSLALLRDEPWMPWVLGGRGEMRFCWTDGYPFQPVSAELRRFYLTAVGYHLSEAAMLLLQARLPDFWEMLLHHTVACSLVVFSYALNYVRIGSLVLTLHGATDVLVYASKALVDTGMNGLLVTTYLCLIVAYAWFRIFVFPVYIMHSAWVQSITEAGVGRMHGWGYLNFALCVLLFLHMYWFGLIVKIGLHFRQTGQARDLQSNLSSLDMQGDGKKES
mmetsp:Transcript_57987/g.149240  ORF Transcript_57987/g.149240 Transcript_57987/m.149240 type:complete len:329 (-) Transcript_57987:72-1058(-)